MASTTPERLIRNPMLGRGWTQVAQAVAGHVSPREIDAIWLFPPARRDEREWGVAVIARRADDGRCRIYTASYILVVRGRTRGNIKVTVEEVGESPGDVLRGIIAGVQDRAGESEPPLEVSPSIWFDATAGRSQEAAQGAREPESANAVSERPPDDGSARAREPAR